MRPLVFAVVARRFALAAALALAAASSAAAFDPGCPGCQPHVPGAAAAPVCTHGQLCGTRCIPRSSICHRPRPPRAPHCRPGVTQACGRVCISIHRVCHPNGQAGEPVRAGWDVTTNGRP